MENRNAQANEKTLDRYQSIISRLAGNSSSLKGWAISIATAVIGFAVKDGPSALSFLCLLPIIILYFLDSYYLALEIFYREKFNEIARCEEIAPSTIERSTISLMSLATAASRLASWGVYSALALMAIVFGSGLISISRTGMPH